MSSNRTALARRAVELTALVLVLASAPLAQAPDSTAARRWTHASGTVVELNASPGGASYSIVTADGRTSGARSSDTTIRLARTSFDPLVGAPAARLLPASGRLRLVQFETHFQEEYGAVLAGLGVEVHRFVPGQAVVAHVPASAEKLLSSLEFVRWTGPFPAEHRLDSEALRDVAGSRRGALERYVVQVMRRGAADKAAVARAVRSLGGRAEAHTETGFLLHATLTPWQLGRVAELDQVLWIERAAPARTASDLVRIDGGANALELRTGMTTRGVRGEVFDEGLNRDHPDFQHHRPILHGANSTPRSHGSRSNGIVFGDGSTDSKARGLLPEGQSIFASFRNLTDRYQHTAELLETPYRTVFQTNSWGNGPSQPGYPSLSFEMDDLIDQYDLLTCQAFGNSGSRVAFRQAWAKNVVTVGGIRHRNTQNLADDAWAGGATIGPATDGRIKPDLSYWNDSIWTTGATGHGNFAGTSAATPCVAGHFGLFFRMWYDERFGNVGGGAGVFASRPHSSTARAALFNSADPYPFTSKSHDLTRTHQGWGRPDIERLLDVSMNALIVDEWRALKDLERARYRVFVREGEASLRATLVYTDPPGNSAAAEHRVNDLTLRVTSPSGTVFWGNYGLGVGNTSRSTGARPNRLDTVEQVWLENPESGAWTVEVLADEVVQDAHPATPELDADFALVVAPVGRVARDLGHGLPAADRARAPVLEALGSFVSNSPWRFDVSEATPGAECWLVMGSRLLAQPFMAGVLMPDPARYHRLTIDAKGRASLSGVLPKTLTGESVYVQAWIRDDGGPAGATATNALEVLSPERE